MTDRIPWVLHAYGAGICVSAIAHRPGTGHVATASAEMCLIDPTEYGVPDGIPEERVYRFSRVFAKPKGQGGGSLVLDAALKLLDEMGVWAVLEASPYPGQDAEALYAFYERHGFRHHPDESERGAMSRPPGGNWTDFGLACEEGVSTPA